MAITFYYYPMSSSISVHWALEELKVAYEPVKVDLKALEQKTPSYLRLNPNGKVPTLVDDGVPMFESLAILIHLAQKYGVSAQLWPELHTPSHMQALSWSTWAVVTVGGNLFRYFYNTSDRFPVDQHNPAQAEAALKEFHTHLHILEQRLTDHSYILGNSFSLADIPIASMIAFANRSKLNISGHPHVLKWLELCNQRAARTRALAG